MLGPIVFFALSQGAPLWPLCHLAWEGPCHVWSRSSGLSLVLLVSDSITVFKSIDYPRNYFMRWGLTLLASFQHPLHASRLNQHLGLGLISGWPIVRAPFHSCGRFHIPTTLCPAPALASACEFRLGETGRRLLCPL